MPVVRDLDIGFLPSVGSSVKTQLQIPKYGRIYGLFLQAQTAGGLPVTAAQLAADITLIRVVADGVEIHSISGRDLMLYMLRCWAAYSEGSMFGTGYGSSSLWIPFANFNFSDFLNQTATALGTADISNLFIEVTFQAGALTVARCSVSEVHDLVVAPWTQYFSMTTFPQTLVAGVNEIQQLPKESDVVLCQYMFVNTNAGSVSLDNIEIIANSNPVLQLSKQRNLTKEAIMKKKAMAPAVDFATLDVEFADFNPSNDLATGLGLSGVTDQRIKLTYVNAPGAMNIVRFANRNRKPQNTVGG